jgi:hypothetical protein
MIRPARSKPALDGQKLSYPKLRIVVGIVTFVLGMANISLPLGILIGVVHTQLYCQAEMIGELAIGVCIAAVGLTILATPKLGYRLLIVLVSVMILLFFSFFIGFLYVSQVSH